MESSKSSPWLRHKARRLLKSWLLNFFRFWRLPVAPVVCQPFSRIRAEPGLSIVPLFCERETWTAISFLIQSGALGVCGKANTSPHPEDCGAAACKAEGSHSDKILISWKCLGKEQSPNPNWFILNQCCHCYKFNFESSLRTENKAVSEPLC